MNAVNNGFSPDNLADKFETLPSWVLLAVAALLYVPLAFLGYGSDSDSLSVVRTGQHFIATFDYVPSRLPGYFVHEVFVFFLNRLGGSLLSNLGTVFMSLLTLDAFRSMCRHYRVPRPTLLTAILMLQPFFWVNAASTIDYIWALGFCFLGFYLLLKGKFIAAAIALALAIGCRLSTILPVGFILVFLVITQKQQRRALVITAAGTALLGVAMFLPPLDFLEWDLSRWLVLSTGDPSLWTPLLTVGRYLYKNLMFFSLPVVIWVAGLIVIRVIHGKISDTSRWDGLSWLSLAVILGVELMFLRIPIEMEYLLPLLPFALILAGRLLAGRPGWLWLLMTLVLLSNFLWINLARSVTPNQASEVIYGFWLEPGYLLQDITTRLAQLKP